MRKRQKWESVNKRLEETFEYKLMSFRKKNAQKGFSGDLVKNLPVVYETQIWSLEQEDPLEKEMTTHSRFLAWEIPWTVEPGRLQSMGFQELDTT